jgi:hypothetical protein
MLLLGTRQLGAVLSGRGEEAAKSAGAVAQAAEERLGSGLRAVWRAGGRLQSAGVDLVFDALAPRPPGAAALAPAAFGLTRGAAGALGELLPGAAALPWQELEDKLEAFALFKYARERLGIPATSAGAAMPLAEQLRRREGLDSYQAVWVTEGLGYAHAAGALRAAEDPRHLLSGEPAIGLPARALVALHAGMGLAFAERSLAPLAAPGGLPSLASLWPLRPLSALWPLQTPRTAPGSAAAPPGEAGEGSTLTAALDRFSSLCRDNAMSGHEDVAREALGLVARNLHPGHVAPIAERLAASAARAGSDAPLAELFWHGVGRGAYFALDHSLPWALPWLPEGGTTRRALAGLAQSAPGPVARNNALAGFAWALALVNIRRPEVVESLLAHLDGGGWSSGAGYGEPRTASEESPAGACASGIAAAILVWHGTAGDDAWLTRFLAHAPDPADRHAAALWRRLVREPCEAALAIVRGVRGGRGERGRSIDWGSLFRYRPLPALLAGLEGAR